MKYENADDVNTDVIWPGKYTYVQMPASEMKKHAMETFDLSFKDKVVGREILVAGKNFGCGSSREQASECLKYSGVKAVIAKSFARIFYRNSINIGLPVIESIQAVESIKDNDSVKVDLEAGMLWVGGESVRFPKYPGFVLEIVKDNGLINHIRKQNGLAPLDPLRPRENASLGVKE
ncbi:MAG TPA: 3-isopropylmalate dehydratase [archaeon]|nr:3-isopropylmalate dehydratase [archaeon]